MNIALSAAACQPDDMTRTPISLPILVILITASTGSSSFAVSKSMTSQEMRDELYGTHQYGHEAVSGFLVDECIEPKGRTVYRVREDERDAPYSEPGFLVITEDAQACFSYPEGTSPGPHCFQVFRNGKGYIFQAVGGTARFVISNVKRGIKQCPPSGVFLS